MLPYFFIAAKAQQRRRGVWKVHPVGMIHRRRADCYFYLYTLPGEKTISGLHRAARFFADRPKTPRLSHFTTTGKCGKIKKL